jgi:FkbM family methyltransferase
MTKANILFIGSNNMNEIFLNLVNKYQNGLFIEAIPAVFEQLKNNLSVANSNFKTNYKAINCLVTDEPDKEYSFNIFSNNGASSSIYEANPAVWKWPQVNKVDTIKLKSTTIELIIKEQGWENTEYDVILDVQGAELDVLRGFGENNLKNVKYLKTEISTKQFYKNGVLFADLNSFLTDKGFKLSAPPSSNHCDVVYSRI